MEVVAAAELIRKGVIARQTFADILTPFREQVLSSEIQKAGLDDLFETARNEVHETKQGKN